MNRQLIERIAWASLGALGVFGLAWIASPRPEPGVWAAAPEADVVRAAGDFAEDRYPIRLCQACGCGDGDGQDAACNNCPPQGRAPGGCQRSIDGVMCDDRCGEPDWTDIRPIPFNTHGQGEYLGPSRSNYPGEYRLRPEDVIDFVYRRTQYESSKPYTLQVGDRIRIESLTDKELDREVEVLPDGTIILKLVGQTRAARKTVQQLQVELEEKYKKYNKIPAITVTPTVFNSRLTQLTEAVNNRFFQGGQGRQVRIGPDGMIRLPGISCGVMAQGLTLNELDCEINQRYARDVVGLEVKPILATRAPAFIYVGGEVKTPNRYELTKPTTVMMALALAGGGVNGGNLRDVVVFRRTDDWCMMATRIDIQGALLGKRPCPADDIWLRDSDVVIVPKTPVRRATDAIELVFTKGVYAVMPPQFLFSTQTKFVGNGSGAGAGS